MLVAKGNTYAVKEAIKACGMTWDKDLRVWTCEKEDFKLDDWNNKYCNVTWHGRKRGRLCSEIRIEEVENA